MSTATKTQQRSSQKARPRRTSSRRTNSPMSPLGRSARELAERGFPVFPLKPQTKVPSTMHGFKEATTEAEKIERWWKKQPKSNIGIATGNGLTVIDIDSEEALDYAQQLGLPDTLTARSGRNSAGQHHYFSGDLPNKLKVHPEFDVQGLGAYIVAPPSVHPKTHAVYEWTTKPDHPLAPVPDWPLEARERPSEPIQADDGKFAEGGRNKGLYKLASAMRGIGMTGEELVIALLVANEQRCDPPLDDQEVKSIAASALRRPVGRPIDKDLLAVCRMVKKPSALAVYVAIRKSCGLGNECFQSYEGLAKETGMAEKTAGRAVATLVEAGFVDKKDRPFPQSNAYRLLDVPEETT